MPDALLPPLPRQVTLIRLELHNSTTAPLVQDAHEFLYVIQGDYAVSFDQGRLVGKPGDLIYLPMGLEHVLDCRRDGSVHLFLLWFEDGRFGPRPWIVHDANRRLLTVLHWLRDHTPPAGDRDRLLQRCLTAAIFHEVESLRSATERMDRDPVQQAMVFMRLNHWLPTLDLREVCDVVGLSPTALNRCFKAATGSSPMAWLRDVRVRAAHDLLNTSRKPVRDIAHAVGFRSAEHLSRLLRRELGRSPRELRRRS